MRPDAYCRDAALQLRSTGPRPIINAASVKGFEGTVKPFLAEYCFRCHGNKGEAKNGLNLQSFQSVDTLIDQRNRWEDVVGMLRRGEMPPRKRSSRTSSSGRRSPAGSSASSRASTGSRRRIRAA